MGVKGLKADILDKIACIIFLSYNCNTDRLLDNDNALLLLKIKICV